MCSVPESLIVKFRHKPRNTKTPNNPVELESLQIKSEIVAHVMFSNQVGIKNIKIIQRFFQL